MCFCFCLRFINHYVLQVSLLKVSAIHTMWSNIVHFYKISALAAVVTLASVGAAFAGTSATINVGGQINPACSIGAGPLSFGNLHLGDVGQGSSEVSVNCTLGASYAVDIGNGAGYGKGAVPTSRYVADAQSTPDYVVYTLWADSGRSSEQIGAQGTGMSDASYNAAANGGVVYTGSGGSDTYTIYGLITADDHALAPAGTYTDAVTVKVYF